MKTLLLHLTSILVIMLFWKDNMKFKIMEFISKYPWLYNPMTVQLFQLFVVVAFLIIMFG
jgi:hypothetical protein